MLWRELRICSRVQRSAFPLRFEICAEQAGRFSGIRPRFYLPLTDWEGSDCLHNLLPKLNEESDNFVADLEG